jgi:hypothetical protein
MPTRRRSGETPPERRLGSKVPVDHQMRQLRDGEYVDQVEKQLERSGPLLGPVTNPQVAASAVGR